MVSKLALLSSLLSVSGSLATPSSRLGARLARRHESHSSQDANLTGESTSLDSNIDYDTIWAGIALIMPQGTFTSVTGTFTVPTPSGANGEAAAAWVGIDGDGCGQGLFQTGIDMVVTDEGATYDVWYEWYPDFSYDFPGIEAHAGDVLTANITAFSNTSGLAIVENHTTGQIVKKELHSAYALCQSAVEWIVEDFISGSSQVPFSNFSSVTFVNAVAIGPGGTYRPCDNLPDLEYDVMDLQVNGSVVTSVNDDGCNVHVQYI